jgi:hypothetical protein
MDLLELFDKTKSAFEHWRRNEGGRTYPDVLKADAIKLLEYYSAQALCGAFSISPKTLRKWQDTKKLKEENKTEFVPLALADLSPDSRLTSHSHLILNLPHRLSLILPEQPIGETAKLVCAIVEEISLCSI